jgi:hypothetical protein
MQWGVNILRKLIDPFNRVSNANMFGELHHFRSILTNTNVITNKDVVQVHRFKLFETVTGNAHSGDV